MTRLRARLRSESGFGLIEVVFAMLVLVVGLLGVFLSLDSSSHLTATSQRQQVAAAKAEEEMEKLKSLSYTSLTMSGASAPVHQNDTTSNANPSVPNYWVSTTPGYMTIPADFNNKNGGLLGGALNSIEPFVRSGGATGVSPTDTYTTSSDSGSGTYTYDVYRYITSVNDCSVLSSLLSGAILSGTCPTSDGKRLTVAVVLRSRPGLGVNKPVWITTVVANPNAALTTP